MAEQPHPQVRDGQSRPDEAKGPEPMLSRYAHLSPVDVDSRELPPEEGPDQVSPVERLPTSQLEAQGRPNKRTSFWKRITMPRPQPETRETPPAVNLSLDPVLNRMLALEKQIAANQSATEIRLEQFEENLTRVWEREEKLAQAEFRERLALLQANQEEIADALHTTGRNLIVLSSLVGLVLVGAVLGVLFLL